MNNFAPFNYAIELLYPLDFTTGSVGFEDMIEKLYEKEVDPHEVINEIHKFTERLSYALQFTVEKYGALREYSIWTIPAFATKNPTGDSDILIAVKAENNGTTVVFSNTIIVPSLNIANMYRLNFEKERK